MSGLTIPAAIPLTRLSARCEQFTKEYVWGPSPVEVKVEILSSQLGDQVPIRSTMVRGISYETRMGVLELSLEDGVHRVVGIQEVWHAVEDAGSVELLEIVRADGGKEIWTFSRVGRPRS